jgi:hypothetical protein
MPAEFNLALNSSSSALLADIDIARLPACNLVQILRPPDFGAKAGFIRDCIERWITADTGLSSQI